MCRLIIITVCSPGAQIEYYYHSEIIGTTDENELETFTEDSGVDFMHRPSIKGDCDAERVSKRL